MDADIEQLVKTCSICQKSRPAPASAPLHPWEWPSQLDFAGPFMGHMFDAYSKWLDVHMMQFITSSKTIEKLRITFANYGLPRKVVTDNGSSFTSEEFRTFMSENGIVHVTSAPYHPSSNELAERAVQTFNNGINRTQGSTIQERLSKFLFTYRITPHTTTGIAPSQLLVRRHVDAIRRRNLPVEPTLEPTSSTSSIDDLYLPDVQSAPTAAPVIPATPVAPATPTTSPAQITPPVPHLTLPPPHPTRRIRRRAYTTSVRKSSRHRPPPARFGWK